MKKAFALLGLMAFAGSVFALDMEGPRNYNVDISTLDAFDCIGDVKNEQLPNGASGLAAQEDQCYPFTARVADNFTGDGEELIGVGWWGVFWNGTPSPADSYDIQVYSSGADGCPDVLLHSENTTDFNETIGDPYGYCANFAGTNTFTKIDGVPYHLAVTAVKCFPPQVGHATGDGDGQQACFKSEFFAFAAWTPAVDVFGIPYELAFLLYNSGGTVPTEEKSWSEIKELYR